MLQHVSVSPRIVDKKTKDALIYGGFGFKVRCDDCQVKFRDGMLFWHCKRCLKRSLFLTVGGQGKRGNHADMGNVKLKGVGNAGSKIMNAVETNEAILGG